jgi:hypothetical protein
MRTSNELSTLYKSIDQKRISDSAKETLKKIRLANKNFKGKDEDAQELFIDFFNKLKSSKPVAVKTTQEYKDAVKKAQIERGKKMREAKGKPKAPKGAGTEEDANRPAKPFGWRMRGKHNYRKPTRDDISKGRAYYEGRVNRADVKRKKYPMLERGGMAENDNTKSKYYAIVDENSDRIYFKSDNKHLVSLKYKEFQEIYPNAKISIEEFKKYEHGGMAEGGRIRSQKEFNELVEEKEKIVKNLSPKEVAEMWNKNTIGSPTKMTEEEGKMSNSKSYLVDLLVEKELSEEEYNQYFEKGGYMAKGGAIENQYEGRTPKDIWDNLSIEQRSHFIYDHAEQIEGLKEREFQLGEVRKAYKSNYADLDEDIKNRFDNHTREGQYAKGGETNDYKSKFNVDDVVYNTKEKTIGIVRMADDKHGEVKTDADGNVDVDILEYYNPLIYSHQNDFTIAPSTKKEIEERNLWKPFREEKYSKGGTIKVGDKVRSTVFKGVEGEVIRKKGDMLFIVKYNALPNGDMQHDVLRISEVEKMAKGGEVFYTEKHKND